MSRPAILPQDLWIGNLFDTVQDAVIVADTLTGTIVLWNPAAERVFGYPASEALGMSVEVLVPDYLKARYRAGLSHYRQEGSWPFAGCNGTLELPAVRSDGDDIRIETTLRHIERIRDLGSTEGHFVLATVHDVTERKQAEEETRGLKKSLEEQVEQRNSPLSASIEDANDPAELLRLQHDRFHAIISHSSDVISILDAAGTILYQSPSTKRVLGHRSEEWIGKNIFEHPLVHPDDLEKKRTFLETVLKEPGAEVTVEFRLRRADGSWRDIEATGSNQLDTPTVRGVVTTYRDVTDRKKAEQKRRESEELYRKVVEQAAENIFVVDVESKRILEANAAFYSSLGYGSEELAGMSLYDIVAHDPDSIDRNTRRVCEKGHHFVGERKYRLKDGSLADVEVNATMISYGDKQAMCVVAHDITDRKKAEDNLRRSLGVLLALREAGQVLGSTLSSEEVVTRLLEIMRGVSNLTAAVISGQAQDGSLRVLRSAGLEALWPRARFQQEAERARWSALEDEEQWIFSIRHPDSEHEYLVGLCLPLKIKSRTVGVLEAYGPASLAENDTVEILSSLASQAASALENARLYEELEQRKRELQELVGKLLGAQEEERRRVAYEVHDGLAQVAAAAHQHLHTFARRHGPNGERGRRDLERVLKLVRGTVSDARRIIGNLRPTVLDDLGLAAAISMEVERLREEGYQVDYEGELGEERLPGTVEIALFRVTQEALTNVRKHAQARRVDIRLHRLEGEVRLKIRDNGRGFNPRTPSVGSGPGERIGLAGMRERVGMFGGELEVNSQPGVGTCIAASVPLMKVS